MSGHSKWATTKRAKAIVDSKRSSLFTKLSKNISVAARDGADPKMNFKLRIAVDKAKEFSMPKDNIERAIARGAGTGEGVHLETVLYEGYGPGGVAIMVEVITDNKNRAFSEVKHLFSKQGGNLGSAGAVAWMFQPRGVITLKQPTITDEQELELIDLGVVDVLTDPEGATILTEPEALQKVRERCEQLGLSVTEATPSYIPKEKMPAQNESALISFLDALDDLDDVNNVYTNADI